MMRRYIYLLLLLFMVACSDEQAVFKQGKVIFTHKDSLRVDVAETAEQRAKGLMFKQYLAANTGLLFVFETETIQRVWMKNTLIPLDVVFISQQGVIISMIEHLKPCLIEVCDIYPSKGNALYMLEMNAGDVDKYHLTIGLQVWIQIEDDSEVYNENIK